MDRNRNAAESAGGRAGCIPAGKNILGYSHFLPLKGKFQDLQLCVEHLKSKEDAQAGHEALDLGLCALCLGGWNLILSFISVLRLREYFQKWGGLKTTEWKAWKSIQPPSGICRKMLPFQSFLRIWQTWIKTHQRYKMLWAWMRSGGAVCGKISDWEQSFELQSRELSSGNTPEHGRTGEGGVRVFGWTADAWNGSLKFEYQLMWNRLEPFIC